MCGLIYACIYMVSSELGKHSIVSFWEPLICYVSEHIAPDSELLSSNDSFRAWILSDEIVRA